MVMLSAHWEKKKTSLLELQEQLQQLPGLLADLESMTANLSKFLVYKFHVCKFIFVSVNDTWKDKASYNL